MVLPCNGRLSESCLPSNELFEAGAADAADAAERSPEVRNALVDLFADNGETAYTDIQERAAAADHLWMELKLSKGFAVLVMALRAGDFERLRVEHYHGFACLSRRCGWCWCLQHIAQGTADNPTREGCHG